MKRLLTILAAIALCSALADAQWNFVRAYSPFKSPSKPDNLWGSHGIAVDPEGKIWVAPYDATDTVTIGSGTNQRRREIFVFRRDGTPAPFSPIKVILGDSLNNNNSGRGITTDHQGNILYSNFNRIFRINYRTGIGINKVEETFAGASITAAGADAQGNIFVSRVVGGGQPIKLYASDFTLIGYAVEAHNRILRNLLVNPEGTLLFVPNIYGGTANQIYVYKNDLGPGLGVYDLVDSIFIGMQTESMAWQPRPGKKPLLWASSGSRENPVNDSITVQRYGKRFRIRSWYAWDLDAKAFVDSIFWGATFPGKPTYDDTVANAQAARPRGIAFTASGDTAYVTMFLADSNSVKMFVKGPAVSVERDPNQLPEGFTLSQNYPNPFNPSTEIRFTLDQAGMTSLRVYDVLGREVATLVNEELAAGVYRARFDAANLPSGTYFYALTSRAYRLSNKMLLVK